MKTLLLASSLLKPNFSHKISINAFHVTMGVDGAIITFSKPSANAQLHIFNL